jgi:hypothetical protein
MSTYYNYVRRGTDAQVDWGKIGTGISDEILRISRNREEQKQELDKINTDLIKSASEIAIPEQEYVKNLVLNGTNEMKNLALMNNNLLKKGLITPAQYRMTMENMKTNVANLDKSVKEFGPAYQKAMERLNNGEMPWLEQQQKEKLFQYGNLQNKTLYVAPDGNMYITEIDDNGNPVADKNKMMNVGVMATGLGYEMKKYDTLGELTKGVNSIGQVVDIVRRGGVLATESAMNNPKYKEARDKYISSMMSNPMNVVSIMGDYLGGYNKVDSESEAGGKNIYIDSNGNARLTSDQIEEVKKSLETQFDSMVSKKATPMPIQQGGGGGSSSVNKDAQVGKNLRFLISGTGPEAKAAAQFFASQNPNIESINREGSIIKLRMKDGSYQEFDQAEEGTNADLISRGLVGFLMPSGISNVEQVLSRGGITPTLGLSTVPIGYKSQQQGATTKLAETTILYQGNPTIASELLINVTPDENSVNDINNILLSIDPTLSVQVTPSGMFETQDKIDLYKDGIKVGTVNFDDEGDQRKLIDLIDQTRTQPAQAPGTQQTQSGQVDYTQF